LFARKAIPSFLSDDDVVHLDLKDAGPPFYQGCLDTEFLPQDVCRPGSAREVVSNYAVRDGHHETSKDTGVTVLIAASGGM
jgi:hypothetical protein